MLIGGAINLGFKTLTGNIHSFTDGAMAFGIGAVAGVAGGFLARAAGGLFGYIGSAPIENIGYRKNNQITRIGFSLPGIT